jgi:hypothetical protein
MFFRDLSLEGSRSLIYSFENAPWLREQMIRYVGDGYQHPERWQKFKPIVETLKTGTCNRNQEEEDWNRADDGSLLIGHYLVWVLLKHSGFYVPTTRGLQEIFLFVKQNQEATFILRNQHGSTTMDLML